MDSEQLSQLLHRLGDLARDDGALRRAREETQRWMVKADRLARELDATQMQLQMHKDFADRQQAHNALHALWHALHAKDQSDALRRVRSLLLARP